MKSMTNGGGGVARLAPRVLLLAVLGCVALLAGGCSSGPRMGVYTISVDPAGAAGQTFDVDLVGVSDVALREWEQMSPDDVANYFSGDSAERADALKQKRTLVFRGDARAQEVDAKDPIWNDWKQRNVMHVAVLTNASFDRGADRGRDYAPPLIVPLDKRRWKSKRIDVQVLGSRLDFGTAPGPVPAD